MERKIVLLLKIEYSNMHIMVTQCYSCCFARSSKYIKCASFSTTLFCLCYSSTKRLSPQISQTMDLNAMYKFADTCDSRASGDFNMFETVTSNGIIS